MRDWCAILATVLMAGTPMLPVPNQWGMAASPPAATERQEADRWFQKGVDAYQAQKKDEAIQAWQMALKIYQRLQESLTEATTLKNLVAVYLETKNEPAAIAHLQQYITTLQKIGDLRGQQDALSTLANLYADQGKYRQAIAPYQQALKLAQESSDRIGEAILQANRAIAYRALGYYGSAIEANQAALERFRSLGDRTAEGKVLGNLGNVYESLGDYDRAILQYRESLKLMQQLGDQAGEALTLGNLGALNATIGKTDAAIELHRKSLAISQAIGDQHGQATTLLNLGSAHHARQQFSQAESLYQQALTLSQTVRDRPLESQALGSLGLIASEQKNYPKAIANLEKSLAIATDLGDPEAQGRGLNNLGHTLFQAGRFDESEKTLRRAIQHLDSLRPELNDAYKVSIFDTQVHTYNLLQQVLIAAKKFDIALEVSEQGRARAFSELLSKRLTQTTRSELPSLSIAQIQKIARDRQATLVEYTLIPDDTFKFQGKQRGVANRLFIWVVKPTGEIAFRQVELAPNSLAFTPNPEDMTTQLEQLHRVLIQPIADLLPTNPVSPIIFIPHESLFLVPFAGLRNTEGHYLIEKHTILMAPSIQVLTLTQQQRDRPRGTGALVVGNPTMPKVATQAGQVPQTLQSLPGSEAEAIAIAQLLKTQPLIGATATEQRVRQALPSARLIHLATHGLLEYGSQEASVSGLGVPGALALAPSGSDSPQDGLLTSSEIFDLKLTADLVVLSACNTGQGRITGDGVIGLSRSLITAGTPSVIVSLWAVPDAPTAKLMTTFYQQLNTQPDKSQALRSAMIQTIKDHPDPIDWAAFMLIGEAR